MKYTAFIFARGGSKGLPGKNIKLFNGKPLIALAIEQAKKVGRIGRVIVSTDSIEIADVAKSYGALVPFMRPPELAGDASIEWHAWRHAINAISEFDGARLDTLISIPATAPLRESIDIENCLDHYEAGGCDVVVTATEAHRSPYFNMVKINSKNLAELVTPLENAIGRRQDAPIVYDLTTVAYVARAQFVMDKNSLFEGRIGVVMVPKERSIDIDSALDFSFAEYIALNRR